MFWQAKGVYTTAVGYVGGYTRNPTYEEVCSGKTGHTEAVLVVFDPAQITYEEILKLFYSVEDLPVDDVRRLKGRITAARWWTRTPGRFSPRPTAGSTTWTPRRARCW